MTWRILKNPNGTWSLSRVSFGLCLFTVLLKVLLNGVPHCGTIDGGMIASLLGAPGLVYAARMHSLGMNANDPEGRNNP